MNVHNVQFLKHSLICASNTLDVIAIANYKRVVILERSARHDQHYDLSSMIDITHNMADNVSKIKLD